MPYLVLFFLLIIAMFVVIVVVTRSSSRNKHSAEIRTFMEITEALASAVPKDKLKKLQHEFCDQQNIIRGDKEDKSDFRTGKIRAYNRILSMLSRKVNE